MEVENLQNNTELADLKATAQAILERMHEEKSRHKGEEKGRFEGGGTLGEIGSLKELQGKEKISVRENGKVKENEDFEKTDDGKQENSNISLHKNGTETIEQEEVNSKQNENKVENLGNLSGLVEAGDVVLPQGELGESLKSDKFWFLKEVIKDNDGEETLRIVLQDREGNEIGDLGRSWEQVTPRYEDAQSYINKLQTIRKALEEAQDEGDEYRADKLGDILKQVRHFALNFKKQN